MKKIHIGFSLIELLIVIVLLSILLLGGISLWREFVQHNRANATVHQITTALQFARSEAIKNNGLVIFCASQNQKTCDGPWQNGQIILIKNKILRIYSPLSNKDRLIWKSAFGKNDRLEFVSTGFTNGQSGSFWYCPNDLRFAKRIVVLQSGRTRVTEESSGCHG